MMANIKYFGMLFFACVLCPNIVSNVVIDTDYDVYNLLAEPDYRAVRLRWRYPNTSKLSGFRIRYCEMSNWNTKIRCKEQNAVLDANAERNKQNTEEPIIQLNQTQSGIFEAAINNLRMLTNYSISVKANLGHSVHQINTFENSSLSNTNKEVIVETKSFGAKTSRCLANSSDIQVHTGPYFSGKISVEGSNNPSCAIYGNKSSTQSVYHFSINHDLCGSKVLNNSRIEAMVIVHENRDILTHNSRRYLVVCTFAPETYTLTASVAVPNHLLKKLFDRLREKQLTNNDSISMKNPKEHKNNTFSTNKSSNRVFLKSDIRPEIAKQANLRDSRMLAEDSIVKSYKHKHIGEEDGTVYGIVPNKQPLVEHHSFESINNLAMAVTTLIICIVVFIFIAGSRWRHIRRNNQNLHKLESEVVSSL